MVGFYVHWTPGSNHDNTLQKLVFFCLASKETAIFKRFKMSIGVRLQGLLAFVIDIKITFSKS